MTHKNWKIAGGILLCMAAGVIVWTSCVLAYAEEEIGILSSTVETETEMSECFVDSSLMNLSPVENSDFESQEEDTVSLYEWDYQKGYPVFDGLYTILVPRPQCEGWEEPKDRFVGAAIAETGTVNAEACLHSIFVLMEPMSEQEKNHWELLIASWGLFPEDSLLFKDSWCYRIALSLADMKQLYERAEAANYSIRFQVDPARLESHSIEFSPLRDWLLSSELNNT